MASSTLTGSRIRERRADLGLKQADLARRVGISPAYLNLIEHNRRRIGGKVLMDLARELGVEVTALTEGAEATLLAGLRDAAAGDVAAGESGPEIVRVEEFAGRFPGWARLVADQSRRIAALEHLAETLTDRLTHDPYLSAALHDVLSTVTAISSTAGILNETPDLDRDWRDRFHRNLAEDSRRLADSSQALVAYLDRSGERDAAPEGPQEELEAWLARQNFHLAELEGTEPATAETVLAEAQVGQDAGALARPYLERYRLDAVALPLAPFAQAYQDDPDPGRLAGKFGVSPACALRRIATLPRPEGQDAPGLVIADGAGALVFRKPVEGFPLPRFGAACPLWPLYQALARPMTPVRAIVELPGRHPLRFLTHAIAEPARMPDFEAVPVFEATMLIQPAARGSEDVAATPVGTSCRICPRSSCAARREPSILGQGDM